MPTTTKRSRAVKKTTDSYAWESLSDEELLTYRIADLGLTLENSILESRVAKLYEELSGKGISFHPPCYLTTEWLCPDRVPKIGIPFCLAHPRLQKLEKTMMLEVEGNTEKECMKLLRHEAGHAINYAYRCYKKSRWRELFGPMSMEYNVQEYYPRPYSKQYVEHLPDNYAQAHPDEDFAETFAVWLTPNKDWRKKYDGWHAFKKLEYVDHLMKMSSQQTPAVTGGEKLWPIHRVKATLASYYKKKRKEFGDYYMGFYDNELLALFTNDESTAGISAADFLSNNRTKLINLVTTWTSVRKYAAHNMLKKMIRRSKDLGLFLRSDREEALLTVSTRLTALLLEDLYRSQHLNKQRSNS